MFLKDPIFMSNEEARRIASRSLGHKEEYFREIVWSIRGDKGYAYRLGLEELRIEAKKIYRLACLRAEEIKLTEEAAEIEKRKNRTVRKYGQGELFG